MSQCVCLTLSRTEFDLSVNVTVPLSGLTVVWGDSGTGKTSLLRCLAGLERGCKGRVQVGNQIWQDDENEIFLRPWQRSIGYVFQEASLFDHLDVRGNLTYGLKRMATPDPTALDEAVSLLGLGHLLGRRTHQLSGGERQRVALGRALVLRPTVLLLDEPLASLDDSRRQEVLPWIEKIRDTLDTPIWYVTHRTDEATRLAQHVLVLHQGRLMAFGSAAQVWPLR